MITSQPIDLNAALKQIASLDPEHVADAIRREVSRTSFSGAFDAVPRLEPA
jgi:SM-20-related protein